MSKDSFSIKYIYVFFVYIYICIYSYCQSNRYSIHNELHSFRAYEGESKKEKSSKIGTFLSVENFPSVSSEQSLFLRFLYLFIHYSEKVRIEISIEKENFYIIYIHPTFSLNFIFLIFPRILFFLCYRLDHVPLSSMTDCALLKDFLPSSEKNPSGRFETRLLFNK